MHFPVAFPADKIFAIYLISSSVPIELINNFFCGLPEFSGMHGFPVNQTTLKNIFFINFY